MSTCNMCFHGEIRKMSTFLLKKKSTLSGALILPQNHQIVYCPGPDALELQNMAINYIKI